MGTYISNQDLKFDIQLFFFLSISDVIYITSLQFTNTTLKTNT